jgi:hypothetical protein
MTGRWVVLGGASEDGAQVSEPQASSWAPPGAAPPRMTRWEA